MRIIFMGKNKAIVEEGLEYLISAGVDVSLVIPPRGEESGIDGGNLRDAAARRGIATAMDREVYRCLAGEETSQRINDGLKDVDLVVSFLFPHLIRPSLIGFPRLGCINFHPAPLPGYGGWGAYIFGILNGESSWGATAHYIDEEFDTGDIIRVERFAIRPEEETAFSLVLKAQRALMTVFQWVIGELLAGRSLPRTPQPPSERRYYSRKDCEKMRRIRFDDPPDLIDRKIRAFWNPPYEGALIEINGTEYTVLNQAVLRSLAGHPPR